MHVPADRRDRFALAAAAIFAAGVAFELWHVVSGRPSGVLDRHASLGIQLVDLTIWALAATALVLRGRSERMLELSFVASVFGALAFLVNGMLLRAAEDPAGIAVLLAAPVVAFLVLQSFRPFPWRRTSPPEPRPRRTIRAADGEEHPVI
jgi:hypothetical protein